MPRSHADAMFLRALPAACRFSRRLRRLLLGYELGAAATSERCCWRCDFTSGAVGQSMAIATSTPHQAFERLFIRPRLITSAGSLDMLMLMAYISAKPRPYAASIFPRHHSMPY